MTHSISLVPRRTQVSPVLPSTVREWALSCGCAGPVLGMLDAQGWTVISDPDANVHCTSPDGGLYVGFLPEAPAARHGDLWHILTLDANGAPAWQQTFPASIPPQAVAGFLAALIATPNALCPQCS
ncbi:DUF317 domain-containing protein [Streptomyces sp. NPDC002490]|uniref:DUF317 domain-containing protein n=1 Tax=Streptomyces sp. NPDC002490 TaxID=3154416 RepID=UPI0033267E72